MNKLTLLIVSLNLLFFGMACAETWPPREKTTLTIRVVDDDGRPVEDANIRVATFFSQGGEERSLNFRTKSDHRGFAHFEERLTPHIHIHVKKQNHYETRKDIYALFHRYGHIITEDEPIELPLREIRNPIPMLIRNFDFDLFEIGSRVGFDVIEFDWVEPYGKGKQEDMIFKLSGDYKGRYDQDSILSVSFPRKGDGFIPYRRDQFHPSRLTTPYSAPVDGHFEPEWQWRKRLRPVEGDTSRNPQIERETTLDSNRAYLLRVRTRMNAEGEVVGGYYGVTQQDFDFHGAHPDGSYIRSGIWWINPEEGNHNLEPDPDQFIDEQLPRRQQAGTPRR